MTEAKQPKPFLKRGTRQFLSNATVRSLNQKPKIVDFGGEQNQFEPRGGITNTFKNDSQEIKVEIKVNNKPKIKKEVQPKNTNLTAKQNKNLNQDKSNSQSLSHNKKKNTALDDYIMPKDNKRESYGKQRQPAPVKVSVHSQPKISMVGALKRQEEVLSDHSDDHDEVIQQKKVYKPPIVPSGSKNQVSTHSNAKKKVINIDLEEHTQKINFNSDSDDDVPQAKKQIAKPQIFPKPVEKKSRWNEDEEIEQKIMVEEPKGPSKILQKFYKKQAEVPTNNKLSTNEKKLTVVDISRQLKQQIFNELLAEKHSDFTKKLDQLHNSIVKSKKERETLEQGTKQLTKEREEFEKEMQRRRKQFEEKINAQNSKLTREKRYLKDQQTNGKVDWRVKNQVQELRGKLEQSENEKKKMKANYTQQIDRLKKKLEQQEQETEALKGQIRCIEMERIEQKAKAKQAQKKNDSKPQNELIRYWQDAPNHSYVSNFIEDNFTLISLDPEYYNYENLEYYIYYNSKKDDNFDLISEQKDANGSKIARKYKNGKEEIEYISKLVKQIFPPPFKFTVVHHLNGDIKMILPQGIHVYFDKKNQITEWKINPDKVIYNFHRQGQIQMKYKNRRLGQIQEFYKGDLLTRTECGQTVRYRRSERGDIIRLGG